MAQSIQLAVLYARKQMQQRLAYLRQCKREKEQSYKELYDFASPDAPDEYNFIGKNREYAKVAEAYIDKANRLRKATYKERGQ
jgi:hypothetical protein